MDTPSGWIDEGIVNISDEDSQQSNEGTQKLSKDAPNGTNSVKTSLSQLQRQRTAPPNSIHPDQSTPISSNVRETSPIVQPPGRSSRGSGDAEADKPDSGVVCIDGSDKVPPVPDIEISDNLESETDVANARTSSSDMGLVTEEYSEVPHRAELQSVYDGDIECVEDSDDLVLPLTEDTPTQHRRKRSLQNTDTGTDSKRQRLEKTQESTVPDVAYQSSEPLIKTLERLNYKRDLVSGVDESDGGRVETPELVLENVNLADELFKDFQAQGAPVTVEDLILTEKTAELDQRQRELNTECTNLVEEFKKTLGPQSSTVLDNHLSIKKTDDGFSPWIKFLIDTHPQTVHIKDRNKRQNAMLEYLAEKSFLSRLHEECLGLLGWLEPTEAELELRRRSLARVQHVINALWPDAVVGAFGSSNNGLALPTGDIDICILEVDGDPITNLKVLGIHLGHWRLVRCMEIITRARVPIIKAIDTVTDFPIDITISQPSSFETTDYVKRSLNQYSNLRPMLIILKLYLQQRGMGETYTGGIGSYLLFAMIVGFLQMHTSTSKASRCNISLGHLLVDFFQFYGYDLDVKHMGISIRGGGSFYNKIERGFYREDRPELLSIESPLDKTTDLGKNSYKMVYVRDAFRRTYERLVMLHYASKTGKLTSRDSILGAVIFVQDSIFTRNVAMTGLRDECYYYQQLRKQDKCTFDDWLYESGDKTECTYAPYVSRIYNHSAARPRLCISHQLKDETSLHFRIFFNQMLQLKKIRKRFVRGGKSPTMGSSTETDQYIQLMANIAKNPETWDVAFSGFGGLNLEDEVGDNIVIK